MGNLVAKMYCREEEVIVLAMQSGKGAKITTLAEQNYKHFFIGKAIHICISTVFSCLTAV